MHYEIMLVTKNSDQQRKITVMDLRANKTITFLLNELDKSDLDEDLKNFIDLHINKIKRGDFDYFGNQQ
ncbi:hypothetical protein [Fictibacillus barbaricus]|uniref:Uncharacterized protein n=1 Tax=Fictibacillus barbaricus TaxID=182136 RepID=A0ABS2Z9J9_9BACL|nr:hypothetical protein [Fictibacillus barbaricus]MBN3544101.1 hypothetical protein [Fictibacillus barbaricus]GGB68938.1 hypothetical protein GCM10007199_38900 [Fictibacillus barbaricus]